MLKEQARRERIGRMMALARVYRGWNSTQLATALGREPSRAVPVTGNPKLDLIGRLADALEWEIGEVAESLADPGAVRGVPDLAGRSFAELDGDAQHAHRACDFALMEAVGLEMRARATTARERAMAANRLSGAYDGMGRYPRVLQCVREGLAEERIGADLRTMLTVNLANACYTLWNLEEARAISSSLVVRFDETPPRGRLERVAQAFSLSIRGQSARRLLGHDEGDGGRVRLAQAAERDLTRAADIYEMLADEFCDDQYEGLAHTARGGAIEASVAMGTMTAEDAVREIVERLDAAVDLAMPRSPAMLEGWGWWSVFGANIALRSGDQRALELAESSEFERAVAICTNKAAEIAEHLGHWAMRERAFTLEWCRRQTPGAVRREDARQWLLDAEDVRVLVGTMGRFPLFRPTGWAILEHASIEEALA